MINSPQFGPMLAAGKTKIMYADPNDETLAYMVSKDQITAGDGTRRDQLAGKARWSTITTANVFRLLNQEKIESQFVRQVRCKRRRGPDSVCANQNREVLSSNHQARHLRQYPL